MRHRFTGFLVVGGLVLGLAPGRFAGCWLAPADAAPTEPGASWVSSYFDELRLLSPGEAYFVLTGPCERSDLATWVRDLGASSAAAASRQQWLLAMLSRELAPEVRRDAVSGPVWVLDASLGGGLQGDRKPVAESMLRSWLYLPGGLTLWTSMRTTANAADYHRVETRPWRDRWRASLDYGGIGYHRGGLSVFAGRDEVSWGASRVMGLLFSGAAPTLDMVKLELRTKYLLFTSFHSELRRSVGDPWVAGVRRFVAAHRLEVLVGKRWDFSVSEAVLYGGEGRSLEPGYLNPLAPFYAEQWNSWRNDNLLVGADVLFRLPGHAEIKGEVVVDDYQIDPGPVPNKLGLGLAINAVNPLVGERSMVGCSYFWIADETYGHAVPWNRFTDEGKVMGFPGGPDGDRLETWSSWAPWNSVVLKAGYSLTRQGEGRVVRPQDGAGFKTAFPSGAVEQTHKLSGDVTWRPSYPLQVQARAQWSSQRNVANVRGATVSSFKASLALTYNLRAWWRQG